MYISVDLRTVNKGTEKMNSGIRAVGTSGKEGLASITVLLA